MTLAFDYARLIGAQITADAIAWTTPILMCCYESGLTGGTLSLALGRVTEACKTAVAKNDNDMAVATHLAMNELLIFHALDLPTTFRPISRKDALELADELERALRLSGLGDWVTSNFI